MARTGKDAKHTKKLIGFLLQVEKDKCNEDNLKSVLNPIGSLFRQQYAVRDKNSAGTILWSYMPDNTVSGAHKGLPKYFMDNFKDKQKIEEKFASELAAFFTRPGVLDFGSSWNCFLVDSSIKDLVIKQLGYT